MTLRARIITLLRSARAALSPLEISRRLEAKYNSVKSACARLCQLGELVRTDTGYICSVDGFENVLEVQLGFDGDRASLPKVHDIHMAFKPQYMREQLAKDDQQAELGRSVYYDREPAQGQGAKSFYKGAENIGCLSEPLMEALAHPEQDGSFYQLWKAGSRKENTQPIKGGFQECFWMKGYKIIAMLYTTGTTKIIIGNSLAPFDAIQFREALAAVNGIFQARTGLCFMDLAPFYYIEKIHLNSDTRGDREFSGTSKLNCTVNQLDGWLYRVYEKVMGDDLYIRQEYEPEDLTPTELKVNSLIAMMAGGPSMNNVMMASFANSTSIRDLITGFKATQQEVGELKGLVAQLTGLVATMTQELARAKGVQA